MALEEYKRKRRFEETPEPEGKVEAVSKHRFVVQMHRATRLHYDFRLELDGVLKSWAVPKGPSLDPADKRLAMQVEDHPVSYFDFEGIIPEGNYGAGSVMVWDVGTWQPLNPVAVQGKHEPGTDEMARAMLAKGDLKFRLDGQRLHGDFALVKIRGRRPGSKGNEWLMIKKFDKFVEEGYDAEGIDTSVLSKRTMDEIADDADSAEWKSRPAGRGRLKAAWLADAVAKLDKKKRALAAGTAESAKGKNKKSSANHSTEQKELAKDQPDKAKSEKLKISASSAGKLPVKKNEKLNSPMPTVVRPMLAETADDAFDDPAWVFEIKWDGYRAVAFVDGGKVRLVSRNQNDLTAKYPELQQLPENLKAKRAVLDGEIVALDEEGRPSFSLLQQRSGFHMAGRKSKPRADVTVLYYAFDLLYADGRDLRLLPLEDRKKELASLITEGGLLRYSDHFPERGKALLEIARQRGLEGIVAKRRESIYQERRSADWRKIKIRHTLECVICGYTEPERSRKHFGSVVLGLYDAKDRLIHVGQAGSGFDERSLAELAEIFAPLETRTNPFYGEVEALRKVTWLKPKLVAEVEYSEWTQGSEGSGPKLRAPVFLRLRDDKEPKECRLLQP